MGQKRNRARAKIRRARKGAIVASLRSNSLCQELVQSKDRLRAANAKLERELGHARSTIAKLEAAARECSPFNTAVKNLGRMNPRDERTYAVSVSLNRMAFRLAFDQSSDGRWREIEYLIENLLQDLSHKLRGELRAALGADERSYPHGHQS